MLALPQSHSFTAKYGLDVHSYIVGTKTERKKKERKKNHRAGRQKKDPAFLRKQQAGNKRAHKHFILGGRLMSLLPDSILEGVGDSLLTVGDRYAYTISVPPRMYNIVGRERVQDLRSECWKETWEARHQQQASRATEKKKKDAENWEKAKREYDSVGGPHFTGLKL